MDNNGLKYLFFTTNLKDIKRKEETFKNDYCVVNRLEANPQKAEGQKKISIFYTRSFELLF